MKAMIRFQKHDRRLGFVALPAVADSAEDADLGGSLGLGLAGHMG